jgi:hypothetical protein
MRCQRPVTPRGSSPTSRSRVSASIGVRIA